MRCSLLLFLVLGLPPSWARAPDAERQLPKTLLERYGSECHTSGMRTWRRKLLWFPGDTRDGLPKRPPFYGSWSKTRCEKWWCCCFSACWLSILIAVVMCSVV